VVYLTRKEIVSYKVKGLRAIDIDVHACHSCSHVYHITSLVASTSKNGYESSEWSTEVWKICNLSFKKNERLRGTKITQVITK
jgi:hypothetical protein